jgi:hypothetical protein
MDNIILKIVTFNILDEKFTDWHLLNDGEDCSRDRKQYILESSE